MLLDKKRVSTFTKFFAVIIAVSFILGVGFWTVPRSNVSSSEPTTLDGFIQQGNAYLDGRQYTEAVKMYEKALAITPNDVNIRTDLAISYYYSGNVQKAIEEANKGVKVNPNHSKVHLNLGIFYKQAQRFTDAKKEFETYLKLEPNGNSATYAKQEISSLSSAKTK